MCDMSLYIEESLWDCLAFEDTIRKDDLKLNMTPEKLQNWE